MAEAIAKGRPEARPEGKEELKKVIIEYLVKESKRNFGEIARIVTGSVKEVKAVIVPL